MTIAMLVLAFALWAAVMGLVLHFEAGGEGPAFMFVAFFIGLPLSFFVSGAIVRAFFG